MTATGRRPILALVAVGAALAASASVAGRSPSPAVRGAPAAVVPAPVAPAFVPGPPRRLGSTRDLTRWAPVRRRVLVRAAPSGSARVVATLGRRTPEGTANLVVAVGRGQDRAGRPWVRVSLPMLPNGTSGWVPRRALGGYEVVDTLLDVDLGGLRLTLLRNGRPVLRAPIAVGAPSSPTPRGRFYVRDRLTRYASPAYGPVAFGTSARSPTLTDWPAGGYVGIHGTDRPDLVPGRVSHGCIRLRNADVLALARHMPVGTPVRIH